MLKGNEMLLNVKGAHLLKLWLVPSRYSPGSFDPAPQHALSLQFSHLLMLFISTNPPAQPAAPAKGPLQPVNRAERCNGDTDQHLTFALDLLLIYSGVSGTDTGRLKVHEEHFTAAIPACPPGTAVRLRALQ